MKPVKGDLRGESRSTAARRRSAAPLTLQRAAGAWAVAAPSGPANHNELAPDADHALNDIEALPALFAALTAEG